MSTSILGAVIGAIVLIASLRLLRSRARRLPVPKLFLLLCLQAASGALLWALLSPAITPPTMRGLTVLTAASDASKSAPDQLSIALPEAPELAGVARVPDLATALRQYPSVEEIHVIGAGLPARDLVAAGTMRVRFTPAPLPTGVVELYAARALPEGAIWQVRGRVEMAPLVQLELLDPAGARVAQSVAGDDGRFVLAAPLRVPGEMLYRLRVLQDQKPLHEVPLPIVVHPGQRARVLIVAGGSNAELKYLRRWAIDAGADVRWSLALRPGVRVQGSDVAVTAENLAKTDLLIVDERAWIALREGERATILAAVDAGLGLLVRITANVDTRLRAAFEILGFSVDGAEIARDIAWPLAVSQTIGNTHSASRFSVTLTRRPIQVSAADAITLEQDADGQALALWRAYGQGRVALWWLGDSYRLVLEGQASAHGAIWANALNVLGRPRIDLAPEPMALDARVDMRLAICGLDADARMVAPDTTRISLLPDTRAGACAAWWPAQSGWHQLQSGSTLQSIYVRAADEAPGLLANALRESNLALNSRASMTSPRPLSHIAPPSRWLWWTLWLLTCTVLWWLERRWLRNSVTEPTIPGHSQPNGQAI